MKALRLEATHDGPYLREVPCPQPGPGEVKLALTAAALNRRDVWIRTGQYPGIQLPITLGSDGCGQVIAAGEGAEAWIGARVILYPADGWGDDEVAQADSFKIRGLPDDGTFAESIIVPTRALYHAPAHLNNHQAAALPLAGLTAWRALFTRAEIAPGNTVLISGVGGGVALMGLQLALSAGAQVFVTSSSASKITEAVEMGAAGGALYTDPDLRRSLRALSPRGFDVILDSAGGDAFGDLVKSLAPGGRLAFYGGTRGKWPKILPQHLFYKQVSILASTMGSPTEFARLIDWVNQHQIVPRVDSVFPLAQGAQAFDYLQTGSQFGKVVLDICDGQP